VSVQFHPPAALLSAKELLLHIEKEGEWAAHLVWTFWTRENLLLLLEIEPQLLDRPASCPLTILTALYLFIV
jgi:hypothetical protein